MTVKFFQSKIKLLYGLQINQRLSTHFGGITMVKESQNIEWKESWRDEYLKWICGFANAQGGKIYIGKNDNGIVVGLDDAKKLWRMYQTKSVIFLALSQM